MYLRIGDIFRNFHHLLGGKHLLAHRWAMNAMLQNKALEKRVILFQSNKGGFCVKSLISYMSSIMTFVVSPTDNAPVRFLHDAEED
jgi:hypothetical protein